MHTAACRLPLTATQARMPTARTRSTSFRASISGGPNKLRVPAISIPHAKAVSSLRSPTLRSSRRGENVPAHSSRDRSRCRFFFQRAGQHGRCRKGVDLHACHAAHHPQQPRLCIQGADLLERCRTLHHHARLLPELRPQPQQRLRGKLPSHTGTHTIRRVIARLPMLRGFASLRRSFFVAACAAVPHFLQRT